MIRVLFVIPTLDRSGAEKQLTLLATGLPRDEFQVEVVALTRSGPYEERLHEADIPLTVIGKRTKFDPFSLRKLQAIIRDKAPDILHTWLFAANAYGRLAVDPRSRPKVVVSERCVDSWKADWQLWFDRRLIPRTDRLIGNSQAVADFYEELGVPADRIEVISNAIETPGPSSRTRQSLCDELGFPVNGRLIGCIGRLAPQKRVKDLLWAFELLQSLQSDTYLLIAGEGPERQELEKFARQIRITDRVCFAGHRADVADILPHLDIFWLASDFEGQSNSLIEAMAAGVPVVVSNIPPNLELVTHERTGLVVPVRDRVAFTRATDRLLKDRSLARSLGAAAREYIAEHHSVDRAVREYAQVYRELAEDKG